MGALREEGGRELFAGMHKLQVKEKKLKRIWCWFGQRVIEVLEDDVSGAERRVEVNPVTRIPTLVFESKRGGRWRVKFRIPGIVGFDDWVHKRNRIYFHFLWDHPRSDRPTEEVNLEIPKGKSVVELHFSPSLVKPNGYSGVILLLGEEEGTDPSPSVLEWMALVRLNIPTPAKSCLRPLHKYHTPIFILPDDRMKRGMVIEKVLELCEESKGPWKQTKIMTTIVSLTELSKEEKERLRDIGLNVVEFGAKEEDRLFPLLKKSEELFGDIKSDTLVLSSSEGTALTLGGALASALGAEFARVPMYGTTQFVGRRDSAWDDFLIYYADRKIERLRRVIFVGWPEDFQLEWVRMILSVAGLPKMPKFRKLSLEEASEEVVRKLSLDMLEFNALRGFDDASELEKEVGKTVGSLRLEDQEALKRSVLLKLIIPQILVLAAYRQDEIEDLLTPLSYSISRRAPLVLLPSLEKEVLTMEKELNQVARASIAIALARAGYLDIDPSVAIESLKTSVIRLTLSLFRAIPQGTRELLNTAISRMTAAFTPGFLPLELASRKSELDEDPDPWGNLFSISRLSGRTPQDTCSLTAFSTLSCLKPSTGSQALIITNPTRDLEACVWETGVVLPRMVSAGLDIDPKNDVLGVDGRGVEKHEAERRIKDADFIHYSGHAELCFSGEEGCEQNTPMRGCGKTGRMHDGCLRFFDHTSVDRWTPLPNNEIATMGRSPFVFMNACHSGKPELAEGFIKAGAKIYVGTLWSVSDTVAALMGVNFYEEIVRSTVTDALRYCKQAMYGKFGFKDPSWLSYVVYGDPAASITLHTQDSFWEASYFEALGYEFRKRGNLEAASLAYDRSAKLAKESVLMSGDDIIRQMSKELESRSAANALESRAELERSPILKASLFQNASVAYRKAASFARFSDDKKRNTLASHEARANGCISFSEAYPEKRVELLLMATKELYAASDSHPEPKTRIYYSAQAAFYESGALYYSARGEKAEKATQRLFSALWCLDIASRDSVLTIDVEGPKREVWAELSKLINGSWKARRTMVKIQKAFSLTHEAEGLQKSAERLQGSGDLIGAAGKYREASIKYREASNLYRGLSELSGSEEYCRGMIEYCSGMSENCKRRPSLASNRLLTCCDLLRKVQGSQTQRWFAREKARRAESELAILWIEALRKAKEAKKEWEEAEDYYYNARLLEDLSSSKELFRKTHGHFLESAKGVRGPQRSFLEAFALRAKEREILSEAKSVEIGFSNSRNGIPDLGLVVKLWGECIRLLEEAKTKFPLEMYKKNVEEEIEGIRYDTYLCQKLSSKLRETGYEQAS